MKKILFLFLFSTQISLGQTYHPFPTSHATWEEAFIGFIGSELETYNVMCGDTVINGIVQSKVYQYSGGPDGEVYGPYYYGSIYEEDMKIWSSNGGELLYDFTLEVGDTFPIGGSKHMVVESIGLTDINGEARRTIYFEPYLGWSREEFWIEGIGSNFGLFSRGMFGADLDPWAKCMKENQLIVHNFDPAVNNCDFTSAILWLASDLKTKPFAVTLISFANKKFYGEIGFLRWARNVEQVGMCAGQNLSAAVTVPARL